MPSLNNLADGLAFVFNREYLIMVDNIEHYKNLDLQDIVYFCEFDLIEKIEQWKDVVGYEGLYKISDLGRVKSSKRRINTFKASRMKNELILKNKIHPTLYIYINLNKDNSNKTFKVHRLVAKTFIPNPENKPEVNHKNGIKSDNFIKNLEWVTPKENCLHRSIFIDKGKLSTEDIVYIRKSNLTVTELSKTYSVSTSTISRIRLKLSYKHIL